MITDHDLPELELYRRLECQLPFEIDGSYGRYVTANGNDKAPVHRWFRYKESFSANLLKTVIHELTPGLRGEVRLLDPFCGVGTALVASQELSALGYQISATGIERNPFAAFVAITKVNWKNIQTDMLRNSGEQLLASVPQISPPIPPLSSITTGRCITTYMAKRVVTLRDEIMAVDDEPCRNALLLGLASAIEVVSKVRKDGRALRIVEKPRKALASVLQQQWNQIASDASLLQDLIPNALTPRVLIGDGRMPSKLGVEPETFDLVLTSPPYPNNIDYSEVYKLELWLLGFIKNAKEFLHLRKSTVRSHPTASIPEPSIDFTHEIKNGQLGRLLKPVLERARASEERWRERLVIGYFSDLWAALKEQYLCLRPNGYNLLVVGNSLHGRAGAAYLIPTDIAVATIAKCIGFKVEHILAARSLRRRLQGNHFLRESIVVLRKP
jgi:SAM-dependent methyltransferase